LLRFTDEDLISSGLLYAFFAVYLVLLVFFLFTARIGFGAAGLHTTINLVPFATIGEQLSQLATPARAFAIPNLLVNLFMFTPLGLYLPILWIPKRIPIYLGVIFGIGFLVETAQSIFGVGAFDIRSWN